MVKKNVFFIQETVNEQALTPLNEDEIHSLGIPILEQQRKAGKKGGTVFRTVLQQADVVNKNKRSYKKNALENALKEESNRISNGHFFGELDHPSNSDPARFSKVELKNSCYRVLSYDWNGNVLSGICETLANTPGKDMQALIVENGIMLGFSLRAMGSCNRNPQTGIAEVTSPMKIFCYDCVSNPSHANAIMSQVLSESLNNVHVTKDSHKNLLLENENQMKLIAESYGYNLESLLKEENVIVNPDQSLAIMSLDNKTIRTFLEEDTVSKFRNVLKTHYI